ncbi:MAG: hypothetical protein NTV80_23600 [Verrucomicrobia bacterium]|nr:hypothetical protein [Verrucomicrobiota bacterium]
MNGSRPIAGLIIAMLGMGYVLLSLLLSTSNQLGGFFGYLLAGSILLGVGKPKTAVVVLLVASGYIDLAKRLLVVADRVSYTDLAFVLGIAPALMAGATIGVFLQVLQGRIRFGKTQLQALGVIILTLVLSLIVARKASGGTMAALQEVGNTAGYACFLFVIPLLYSKFTDQVKLIRTVLIAYLPIPIYGIYQAAFGLAEYEIEYLKTGMSILIKQLLTGDVRPFSTLNSPTALGAICGIMALLAFLSGPLTRPGRKMPHPLHFFLGIIYIGGLLASTSRSDFFIPILGAIMALTALSPMAIRLFYLIAVTSYIGLIMISGWLQERLADIQIFISTLLPPEFDFIEQLTRVQTFSDRLEGFRNLANNPQVWSFFGVTEEVSESIYSHDPLTQSLLAYGVVPVGIVILVCVLVLSRIHAGIISIHNRQERWMAALALGTTAGIVATSMLSGSRTSIFPITVFLWLMLGIIWARIVAPKSDKEATASTENPAFVPSRMPPNARLYPAIPRGNFQKTPFLRTPFKNQ